MRREENMGKLLSIAALALGLAAAGVRADEAEVKAASAKVKNQTLKDHLMQNIDIFGKSDLPAVYILAPGEFADEEIKGQLLARDFSRDPFFMQNIDREEFELKMTLREFQEDEKAAEKK
jgi:hypothetical protein